MPRFHFHLHECGTVTLDEEGRDFPDAFAALMAARQDARMIMAHEVRDGRLCLGCHIEVVSADTGERENVRFSEALTVTGL